MKKNKKVILILALIFIICLCIAKWHSSKSTKTDNQQFDKISSEIAEDGTVNAAVPTDEIMIQNTSESSTEKILASVELTTEVPTRSAVNELVQEQTNETMLIQIIEQSKDISQEPIAQTTNIQQEQTKESTQEQTQAPTEVPAQTPTEPVVKSENNCPYTLYTITTRYVENGLAGSKEYIGYYYSNNEQTQAEITVAMQLYKMGYINNMWVNVGDYDDHRKVAFAYYWK